MEWLLKAGDKFNFIFLLILTFWVEQGLRQYIMTLWADSFCSNLAFLNSEYSLEEICCSSEYLEAEAEAPILWQVTYCKEPTHWKRLEKIEGRRRRGQDG